MGLLLVRLYCGYLAGKDRFYKATQKLRFKMPTEHLFINMNNRFLPQNTRRYCYKLQE
jgi:hypothetical protein